MDTPFQCRHTCVHCAYSSPRLGDRNKHEKAHRPHAACSDSCPAFGSVNIPAIRIQTPATYSERPDVQRAASTSSTSSRKRSRAPTPEEDPEEKLRRNKLERFNFIRNFKICFVFDPSRAVSDYEEAHGDWCWVDAKLSGEESLVSEVVASGDFKGYAFPHPENPLTTVRINDWAYIAYVSLRQSGYDVKFKRWSELSELLTGGSTASVVAKLIEEGFDCILGGIDLSIWAPYEDDRSMKNKERDAFIALGNSFPVFPSPQGCLNHGAKIRFNEVLGSIASDMGTSRPRTERLEDVKKPPYGLVLKREFSDASRGVFLPNLTPESQSREVQRAAAFVRKNDKASPGIISSWLAQEYVPFLSIGEVRFVCVGGRPIREIVTGTHPGDHPTDPRGLWGYEHNDSLKTLSALQEVVDSGLSLTEDRAFDPNRGTAEKEIARNELHSFVVDFLNRLAVLDGANSSLRVFCRVDVSVFVDEKKKVSFYVNEVERGLTTCLWSGQGASTVGHVGTDLAWPLACWIQGEKKRLSRNFQS